MNKVTLFNTALGMFVAGFNTRHQIVTHAPLVMYGKRFNDERAANAWLDRYADAGYGLQRGDVKMVRTWGPTALKGGR